MRREGDGFADTELRRGLRQLALRFRVEYKMAGRDARSYKILHIHFMRFFARKAKFPALARQGRNRPMLGFTRMAIIT